MSIYFTQHKRPRYFDRQQLSASDLSLEQQFHIERDKDLNRYLHGWGIVCGALPAQLSATEVKISKGFAILPSGQHLHIPAIDQVDLANLIAPFCCYSPGKCEGYIEAIEPSGRPRDEDAPIVSENPPQLLYLIARYTERDSDPKPSLPEECRHPGNTMQYSRTCSGVSLDIIDSLSAVHNAAAKPCEAVETVLNKGGRIFGEARLARALINHFECPGSIVIEDDYVILAELLVGKTTRDDEAKSACSIFEIHYAARKHLLSVQTIQEYLHCLCVEPSPSPTPSFTFSPTATPTFTFSATPSFTFSATPSFTFSATPSFTFSATASFSVSPSFSAQPTFNTILPSASIIPSGVFTMPPYFGDGVTLDPGLTIAPGLGNDGLTYPMVDGIIPSEFGGIDIRYYDAMHGAGSSVDNIELLSATEKTQLRSQGYASMLDIALVGTEKLAEDLSISEVKAVELRDRALGEMRREEPITISIDEYDIALGLQTPTNEVAEVGPVRQKRLRQARLNSVTHIANASVDTLETVLEVSPDRALRIKESAQGMIKR